MYVLSVLHYLDLTTHDIRTMMHATIFLLLLLQCCICHLLLFHTKDSIIIEQILARMQLGKHLTLLLLALTNHLTTDYSEINTKQEIKQ